MARKTRKKAKGLAFAVGDFRVRPMSGRTRGDARYWRVYDGLEPVHTLGWATVEEAKREAAG